MTFSLVTGASSGLGAEVSRRLAKKGHTVALVARSEERLSQVAAGIDGETHVVPCDLGDAAAVADMAKGLQTGVGTPDLIVHCAGAGAWKPLWDTPPDEAHQMMGAPYFAAYHVTHAFIDAMRQRRSGTQIYVNSPACFAQWPESIGYAAARAALAAFHNALYQDLAGSSVSVSHVVLGRFDSAYFDTNDVGDDSFPLVERIIPTLSLGDAAEHVLSAAATTPHTLIRPRLLSLFRLANGISPGLVRWVLRQ